MKESARLEIFIAKDNGIKIESFLSASTTIPGVQKSINKMIKKILEKNGFSIRGHEPEVRSLTNEITGVTSITLGDESIYEIEWVAEVAYSEDSEDGVGLFFTSNLLLY